MKVLFFCCMGLFFWFIISLPKQIRVGKNLSSEADIAVFNLRKGDFGLLDSERNKRSGDQKLETELTLSAGSVVWDLHGIASLEWDEKF